MLVIAGLSWLGELEGQADVGAVLATSEFIVDGSVVHLEAKRTGGNQQSTGSCSGELIVSTPL